MALAGRDGLMPSLALGIFVVLIDRAHKYFQIEMEGWRGGEFISVTSFFDYVLVWNTGVSYGLLNDLPMPALLAIMGLATILLLVWWLRGETVLVRYGLALCLGGATSHIIDRWIYGAVPDFFHFHWEQHSFYVFNISDTAISFGVVILLVDMVMQKRVEGHPS